MIATTDGIKDEVDRPQLYDVEVVFGEVAKYDENQVFGTLVDEDGFLCRRRRYTVAWRRPTHNTHTSSCKWNRVVWVEKVESSRAAQGRYAFLEDMASGEGPIQ